VSEMNSQMDERASESEVNESDELDDAEIDELEQVDADDSDELEPDDEEETEADDADDDEIDQDSAVSGPGADLEELVRYVASRLVQDTGEIEVESELRGGTVYVSLRVPESEMGRVIGREGRTAKAIRTLVSIAGSRRNVHARLDIDG
jgi:predicted RNA-binding protein YlqC (UPF0109 family)